MHVCTDGWMDGWVDGSQSLKPISPINTDKFFFSCFPLIFLLPLISKV